MWLDNYGGNSYHWNWGLTGQWKKGLPFSNQTKRRDDAQFICSHALSHQFIGIHAIRLYTEQYLHEVHCQWQRIRGEDCLQFKFHLHVNGMQLTHRAQVSHVQSTSLSSNIQVLLTDLHLKKQVAKLTW
jgi:hypothetical protein